MDDSVITLAHGNGGRLMRELITGILIQALHNPLLDPTVDAVRLAWDGGDLVITTDGFTVQPLEFPGGDLGSLALHGTVNDLAVAGAEPRYLTLGMIIEEGFALDRLRRLAESLGRAALGCGVAVVAGDTKVVRRGEAAGLYLTTTGVGVARQRLGMGRIAPGDRVVVSGPVGEHGTAVLLARQEFGLRAAADSGVSSDCGSVLGLTRAVRGVAGVRFMRDPTRGGLATVCHEIALTTGLGIRLEEAAIPVRSPVRGVCDLLGFDPLFLACEGRVVAVVAREAAETVRELWRALPEGAGAAVIGTVERMEHPRVIIHTRLGGARLLPELEFDPLPRIC